MKNPFNKPYVRLLLALCLGSGAAHAEWLLELKEQQTPSGRQFLSGSPLAVAKNKLEWQTRGWSNAQQLDFSQLQQMSNQQVSMKPLAASATMMIGTGSGSLYNAKITGLKDKKLQLAHAVLGDFSLETRLVSGFGKRRSALCALDADFANWKLFSPGEKNALPSVINANRILFNSPGAVLKVLPDAGYIQLGGYVSLPVNAACGIVIGSADTSADWSAREFCEAVRKSDQNQQAAPAGSLQHTDFNLAKLCKSGLLVMLEHGEAKFYRISSEDKNLKLERIHNDTRLDMRYDAKFNHNNNRQLDAREISAASALPQLDYKQVIDAPFHLRYNVRTCGFEFTIGGSSVKHKMVLDWFANRLKNVSVMFFNAQRLPVSFTLNPSYYAFDEKAIAMQADDRRDAVELQGGKQRLLGELQKISRDNLEFKTSYAKLQLPLEQIDELLMAKTAPALPYDAGTVRVMLDCGSQLVGELLQLDAGQLKLRCDGHEFDIKLQHVKELYFSPQELPESRMPLLPKDIKAAAQNPEGDVAVPQCGVMAEQIERD